jgi:uncharacterized integral membrane protein (TIGR00697 family)
VLFFGRFVLQGGIVVFPISYIFGDVLVEVYGYARSRRVIWLGFMSNGLAAVIITVVVLLPPAPDWPDNDAFTIILGQTPRIVLASLIAFWCGEFVNSYTMAKMKLWTNGRWLWTRTVGSTMTGEAVDTVLFITLAFCGKWDKALILNTIASNYVAKVAYEILATPLTYVIVGWLKNAEKEDYYDRDTNFNPFMVRT